MNNLLLDGMQSMYYIHNLYSYNFIYKNLLMYDTLAAKDKVKEKVQMNRLEMIQKYWRYYLLLEKRFLESLEYVELHTSNYESFSNGYALLIQATGAELDTIFKEFCEYGMEESKKITDYKQYILKNNQEIVTTKIELLGYDIEIGPFYNWNRNQAGKKLCWWTAFTSLKHNRFENLRHANQKNILNILGALYLVEMMLLKKITKDNEDLDVFDESSKLFKLKNWESKAMMLSEVGLALVRDDPIKNKGLLKKKRGVIV